RLEPTGTWHRAPGIRHAVKVVLTMPRVKETLTPVSAHWLLWAWPGHGWRLAMSMRAAHRHTWHGVRTGERPAALLRDPRHWAATRAAPRRADDHRPQLRAVARTPGSEQAGDRGGAPGPRAHRRHRPGDDDRGAGRRRRRAARPSGNRRGRRLRLQPRRSRRVRDRARRAQPGRQAHRRLGGRPPPAGPRERATRRRPDADTGRVPGDARRLRRGRSRPPELRRVRGQNRGTGTRVPGVDRRAAITAGADPADLRRPRLLTAAGCGGDVRTPAERTARGTPRNHARRRDTAAR